MKVAIVLAIQTALSLPIRPSPFSSTLSSASSSAFLRIFGGFSLSLSRVSSSSLPLAFSFFLFFLLSSVGVCVTLSFPSLSTGIRSYSTLLKFIFFFPDSRRLLLLIQYQPTYTTFAPLSGEGTAENRHLYTDCHHKTHSQLEINQS